MERLATTDGAETLRARQEALYPHAEIRKAIEQPTEAAIVDFLEREFGTKK